MSGCIFMGNRRPLKLCVREQKLILCFLLKSQVTRKNINLPKSFILNYAKLVAILYLVKLKTSIDTFGSEKRKVTFGFKDMIY